MEVTFETACERAGVSANPVHSKHPDENTWILYESRDWIIAVVQWQDGVWKMHILNPRRESNITTIEFPSGSKEASDHLARCEEENNQRCRELADEWGLPLADVPELFRGLLHQVG